MESRPPQQDSPRKPSPAGPNNRKPPGSGEASSPTPPWLWVFLIAVIGLIIYLNTSKSEVEVTYNWFLDQVENDNVKSVWIQGTEVRGELRDPKNYQAPKSTVTRRVAQFSTYFPSVDSIQPVVESLRSPTRPVRDANSKPIRGDDGKPVVTDR